MVARKKSLIDALIDDYGKYVKARERKMNQLAKEYERNMRQQAAEQKRIEALTARLEREKLRQERLEAKQKAAEEKAQEQALKTFEKEKADVQKIRDRYLIAEKRYHELSNELLALEYRNANQDLIDHGIALCTEAVSLVPEMMDFCLRLRKMPENSIASAIRDLYSIDDLHMPFSILADLYACQRRYPYAIRTCKDAMEFGFTSYDEHTTFEEFIHQLESEMEDTDDGKM